MTIEPWMTRAAAAIRNYQEGDLFFEDDDPRIASIIADHAPMVRALEWHYLNESESYRASTPFGDYEYGGDWWTTDWTATQFVETPDAAKAAAQADFERRVSECFAEAQTESTPTDDEPGDFERGNY